ncbi:MAG: acetyltransferases and hydrolases with the alpha/beta hydrolase fold protein [uncultured bacterium]|nr:MAG: acetyltransferases and hydrolases with the alpha/beta hydrolase fold protein [uncultured bacterium]
MKKQIKFLLLVSLVFSSLFIGHGSFAAGPTVYDKFVEIRGNQTWTKENSPYIINAQVTLSGGSLTIEPGVVVKFGSSGYIYAMSNINAVGTPDERIIFTSAKDDEHGGDTNKNGFDGELKMGEWQNIGIVGNRTANFEYATFLYATTAVGSGLFGMDVTYRNVLSIKNCEFYHNLNAISISNIDATIESNIIANNNVGVSVILSSLYYKHTVKITNNSLYGNRLAAYAKKNYPNSTEYVLDASNNWWGSSAGPRFVPYQRSKSDEAYFDNAVSANVRFNPWLGKDPNVGCQENCYSNVMFLPGIKASKLYKKGALGEDQLWPPNYFGNDVEELQMDDDGKSLENVYTGDVLEEVGAPVIGGNIYKTFLGKLADMKEAETINDYEVFAYDWRQNVEDVAQNGTPYEDNMKSAISQIESLAQTSKSEKVTIVAHSNGGLLAKAIMMELEKRGLADKVDKIVMVGTPQMGTPLAMLSLLYGYDEAALLGTLISREESRKLAENMPGAYGLLPSSKYFERMENPFISFSSQRTEYEKFMDVYGNYVGDSNEFMQFLSGKGDGREKPDPAEIEKENVLNEKLLIQAKEMHERLDNWAVPEGIEVIQVAGWGLDTVSGVKYTEKEKVDCYMADSKIPSCIGMGEYEPIYEPEFTVDGDGVVVAPSALMMSANENVERYWVDLWLLNKGVDKDRKHKDILELTELNQFVQNIVKNEYSVLPMGLKKERPNPDGYDDQAPKLRMTLYSPLDIHLYDEKGNHTGPKKIVIDGQEKVVFEEGIPNSRYQQFGDRKYVGFEGGENVNVVMDGYAIGAYTLSLEEVKISEEGEEVVSSTIFKNLPTTADAKVSFAIPSSGLEEMTTLEADMDSDGRIDYEIDKTVGGEVELPVTLEMISMQVDHLAKLKFINDSKAQDFLQVKIRELIHERDMIEKMDEKNNKNPKENQIKLLNKKIDDLVGFINDKFSDSMTSLAEELLIKNLNSVRM